MRHSKRPDHLRMCSSPPETAIDEPGIDSPVFSLKVTTGDGNTSELPISADVLADMFRSVPDSPEMGWLFDVAARHPSMKVRSAIARYEHLSDETVRLLAKDPCSEIRRQLVSSAALKQFADTETVLHLAASDPVVDQEFAERLYEFTGCCIPQVEAYLSNHLDPSVRLFLAHIGEVSDSTLTALAGDIDPGVAVAARRGIRMRRDCRGASESPDEPFPTEGCNHVTTRTSTCSRQ